MVKEKEEKLPNNKPKPIIDELIPKYMDLFNIELDKKNKSEEYKNKIKTLCKGYPQRIQKMKKIVNSNKIKKK